MGSSPSKPHFPTVPVADGSSNNGAKSPGDCPKNDPPLCGHVDLTPPANVLKSGISNTDRTGQADARIAPVAGQRDQSLTNQSRTASSVGRNCRHQLKPTSAPMGDAKMGKHLSILTAKIMNFFQNNQGENSPPKTDEDKRRVLRSMLSPAKISKSFDYFIRNMRLNTPACCQIIACPAVLGARTVPDSSRIAAVNGTPWGLMEHEVYRVSTFLFYPGDMEKFSLPLARSGLVYIGDGESDKVICFYCLKVTENWQTSDSPGGLHEVTCHRLIAPESASLIDMKVLQNTNALRLSLQSGPDVGILVPPDEGGSQPNRPVVSQPNLPEVSQPNLPVVSQPNLPVVSQPNFPVVSQPNLPEVSQPNLPEVTQTNLPPFSQPNLPEVSQQNLPEVSQPNLPEVSQPNLPVVSQPNLPEVSQPNLPEVSQPNLPEVTQPNLPEVTQPNLPEVSQPNLPEVSQPKLPVVSQPNLKEVETLEDRENLSVVGWRAMAQSHENLSSKNETDTESNRMTETKGNTMTETKGNKITETEVNKMTETEGNKMTETEGNTMTEAEGNKMTETEGNTMTETGGNMMTETKGNTMAETECNAITETEGNKITETEGNTMAETECNAITETEGNKITETEGNTMTEAEGNKMTETEGNTMTETKGNTMTETEGNSMSGAVSPATNISQSRSKPRESNHLLEVIHENEIVANLTTVNARHVTEIESKGRRHSLYSTNVRPRSNRRGSV